MVGAAHCSLCPTTEDAHPLLSQHQSCARDTGGHCQNVEHQEPAAHRHDHAMGRARARLTLGRISSPCYLLAVSCRGAGRSGESPEIFPEPSQTDWTSLKATRTTAQQHSLGRKHPAHGIQLCWGGGSSVTRKAVTSTSHTGSFLCSCSESELLCVLLTADKYFSLPARIPLLCSCVSQTMLVTREDLPVSSLSASGSERVCIPLTLSSLLSRCSAQMILFFL
ncbi:uncharacterized protein LOC118173339 [Oxyura jamaicensis]|uniref:uncharacterized protein LOC118173339 n=1 Tax=Oxyura jamaicensis TaxID=8884 RepID=UPI0015A5F09C|nr:uncharacterized protein LOC118173339 [Oxyura jamaicensis]